MSHRIPAWIFTIVVVVAAAWPGSALAVDPTLQSITVEKNMLMRGFYMGTKAEVTLSGPAPSGGTTVTIAQDSQLGTPNGVKVPAGQTKRNFDVWEKTSSSTSMQYATVALRATLGTTTKSVNIDLRPFALNVTLNPAEIFGGTQVTGTVTVGTVASGAPGTASVTVTPFPVPSNTAITLTSDNAAVTVPGSVTVSKGASSATFSITTKGVSFPANVRVTGAAKGWSHIGWLSVKVPKLKTLTLSAGQINSGSKATATLTLEGPAADPGIVILPSVQTNHPQGRTIASVPSPLTIPGGQTSLTFDVVTVFSDVDVTATVRAGKQSTVGNDPSITAPLTVKAAQPVAGVSISSVSVNPSSVVGGQPVTGTVALAQPSPSGGVTLMLRTVLRVPGATGGGGGSAPATVTIPAGQTQATFPVSTLANSGYDATQLLVLAQYSTQGASPQAIVTLQPTALDAVTFGLTIMGATSMQGTLSLNGPAPEGGMPFTMATSNSTLLSVPSPVTVPAGASSATFTANATPGSSDQVVTVSASRGPVTKSATVTVGPMRALEMPRGLPRPR